MAPSCHVRRLRIRQLPRRRKRGTLSPGPRHRGGDRGPGGIWVTAPDGKRIGIIRWPEQAVNFAFGGPDLRTLFCCAHTSVYTLRVKVPGNPHPWYRLRR